jgi:hypothetical protein
MKSIGVYLPSLLSVTDGGSELAVCIDIAQRVAPGSENCEEVHDTQLLFNFAPVAELYVLAGHRMHDEAPLLLWYCPPGHVVHWDAPKSL